MYIRHSSEFGVVYVWSPQKYISIGKAKGADEQLLNDAIEQIKLVTDKKYGLPSILSLNHLAVRTKVDYLLLREIASGRSFYRKFSINKRSGGKRYIHVPSPELKRVQKWINVHILKKIPSHPRSFAFAENSSIFKCANEHSGAKWLIKMDVTGFFESISEIDVYRVFKKLGYQPLVAFELARISTVSVGELSPRRSYPTWRINKKDSKIWKYRKDILGYLPQGAPTSPMLSNLVMLDLDAQILSEAEKQGLTYTRYSDDLTFSKRDNNFNRKQAQAFIREVSKILSAKGFRPQHRKTTVVPPGSRKVVLGLLVDGDAPRLRREFKDLLRQHLYYLEKLGPDKHVQARNFDSIWGMKSHIRGLIDYANMVEPEYANDLLERFERLWVDF